MNKIFKVKGSYWSKLTLFCVISFLLALDNFAAETGDYIHYRLGVKFKNEKKYDKAIDEFRKVLSAYPDNYNAYMHMAEIRMAQDRYRLVIYNLKKALAYNPGWGKAHKMLATAYEKDGQLQNAVIELQNYQQSCDPTERDSLQKQIDRIAKIVGKPVGGGVQKKDQEIRDTSSTGAGRGNVLESADQDLRKIVDLYEKGKLDQALSEIRTLLKSKPNHSGAYYYAGLIRNKKGQSEMARINFLKAVNFPQLGQNSHFYLGKIYAENGNTAEAIKHLSRYIEKSTYEPGKKEARDLLEKLKKDPGALKSVKSTQTKKTEKKVSGPAVKEASSQLSGSSSVEPIQQEKYAVFEMRIDSLLSMMTVDTLTDLGQKLLLGIHEFKRGNYDASIREFKKVMVAHPDGVTPVHCIYNTGVCYFKLGLFKEAENQFQQILDRYANQKVAPQCLFLKALTYLERDEPMTAEKLFRDFIQKNRDHEWAGKAFEKLGECYESMEQPKKAIDAYQQAALKGKNLDRVCAYFKAGTVYQQIGNSIRAQEAFKSAIDLGEKHDIYYRVPDSYYRIADEKYKGKDYEGALRYYTKVTRKYPAFQETPWGLFQIGSIHKNLKRYQDAVNAFKDLVRKYPDDYWAKQAKWKMEDAIWENEYRAVLK
ncbi:MAG: tetratricopeptide repeat protein [Fibrobacter sp.]|jgi:tetratricopeptide (TPR) repeat protein|nr:tetratricopeptide repeat protein [Fibrobacter sp.]